MVQQLLDVRGLRLTPTRGVVAASVVILVGAMIVVVARLGSRRPSWALAAAFGAFVLIRVIAALALDGPLVSDWLRYEQLARGAAQGAPPIADIPMGYPYLLAAGYALLGQDAPVGELLNIGLACTGAALLAVWVERLADRRAAAIAVLVLAICPSQVLYGVILGTEVAYATALVALALLATLIVRRIQDVGPDRVVLVIAGLAGLLLGASAYVRATSFAIAAVPRAPSGSRYRAAPGGRAGHRHDVPRGRDRAHPGGEREPRSPRSMVAQHVALPRLAAVCRERDRARGPLQPR